MKKRATVRTGEQPVPRAAVPAESPEVSSDSRTRDRVARLVYAHGPQTAAALAGRLGLTAAAVRRHLDAMVADGTLVAREQRAYGRRGRGRPARVFALSEAGHAAMPHAYDDIATAALRHLAVAAGPDAVVAFARDRAAELERRYREELAGSPAADRPRLLAEGLSRDGYAATTREGGVGVQLCQHHCPVQHVAQEFPQLCEAETEALGRLLGTHVQRLATIAHGDGVCTTHVPGTTFDAVPPGGRRRGADHRSADHRSTDESERTSR